jgi:TetR/AcrR family transcriptional regulator, tetracycline repressor protein
MAGRPKKGESNLDVGRIVQAAWRLVDREGVEALSTRALAAELNVKGPALYWHVRNKQQLLSLMLESALGDTIVATPANAPWWEWLQLVGREQRRTLLAHRDSGLIASRAPPTDRLRDEIFPKAMSPLMAAGFSKNEAAAAFGSMASLVLGTVIYEQDPATRAFLLSFNDPDESFDFALDAYVTGLRSKLADKASAAKVRRKA